MHTYDTIVLGVGGMGSAALCELARRGRSVLGIEQFGVAHSRGSSHGQTRIIRRAYFEHPDYVPLVDCSLGMWRALEESAGRCLLELPGLLLVGPPEGAVIRGVQRARRQHALQIDDVGPAELARRWPDFRMSAHHTAMFEREAGFLHVEECVAALCQAALNAGAELKTGEAVTSWEYRDGLILVETQRACYLAESLVVCGGAWTSSLLPDLDLPIRIRRKVQLWFRCEPDAHRLADHAPVFAYDVDGAFFYGFPSLEPGVIKVSEHTGVEEAPTADALDREFRAEDAVRVQEFIRRHLPRVHPEVVRHAVCMYSMTPDEHFIIDRHPRCPNVVFAAGFSGHGFKFAPAVGAALADLLLLEKTDIPCQFLRLKRPSLCRPGGLPGEPCPTP